MEFCPKCGSVLFPDENNALNCSCGYFTYLDNDREYNIKEKILLVKPTYIGVSTRLAFSLYGENTNELKVSNLDNIEKAIKDGNVLELEKNIENTLEQIVLQNNMKLAKFKAEIESLYEKKFFMSGSGSTFFTFISKQEESEIRKKMNYRISRKYFTRITRFL